MKKLFIPFLAVFFFIFESIFVNLTGGNLFGGDSILVPRFLMILFTFLAVYSTERKALWYSFIIGLLFDIVYTGIIGIYMTCFPLVTYAVSKIMKILQNNIFVVSVTALISVAALEVLAGGFHFILGMSGMNFKEFSSIRLIPTLLLNGAAILILAWPLRKWILKYGQDENQEMLFRKKS